MPAYGRSKSACLSVPGIGSAGTRNFLTFVNTTAIAYGQKIDQSLRILVACNSSRVYKRQKITSTYTVCLFRIWERTNGTVAGCWLLDPQSSWYSSYTETGLPADLQVGGVRLAGSCLQGERKARSACTVRALCFYEYEYSSIRGGGWGCFFRLRGRRYHRCRSWCSCQSWVWRAGHAPR